MSGTMHFILEIAMFVLACGMILAFIRASFYGSYCGD